MVRTLSRSLALLAGLVIAPSSLAQPEEVLGKKKGEWITVLQTDKSPQKRRAAVVALNLIGPTQRDVASALARAFREDQEPIVRQQILGVLGGLKKDELREWVPRLADALKYDKVAAVRAGAADVLATLGDLAKPVLSNLSAALKDEDPSARAAAVNALGRIGEDAKVALPDMIALLKDKDLRVRLATAFALGKLPPEGTAAVSELGQALTGDAAPEVRTQAARSLGLLGPAAKDAVPALVNAMREDKAAEVRQQVVRTLRKLGDEAGPALPALKDAMRKDADTTVRLYAVSALPDLAGAEIGQVVKDFASQLGTEPDGDVRRAIIVELGALGSDAKEALPALVAAQRDVQVIVREAANLAVKKVRGEAKPKDKE